jgi:hypothetical protein
MPSFFLQATLLMKSNEHVIELLLLNISQLGKIMTILSAIILTEMYFITINNNL